MDFHRDGKEGFCNPSDLTYVRNRLFKLSKKKVEDNKPEEDIDTDNDISFNIKEVERQMNDLYKAELNEFLTRHPSWEVCEKEWTKRVRHPIVWNPLSTALVPVTLILFRIKKKNEKRMVTFTGTILSTYGRYSRIDALMFLAVLSECKTIGVSINNACLDYSLYSSTCRKWAKDLLPLLDKEYMPGMNLWDTVHEGLKDLKTSDDFRDFFKANMDKATKGMFATYKK